MKKILLILVGLMLIPAASARAKDLTMLSGYQQNFIFFTELGLKYMEQVEQASEGKLSFKVMGPETIPTFEQFEPLQAGAFDLLFTHPAYHSGTTAVGLAIDAIAVDPKKRREAGVIDFIDRFYQKKGVKLLSAPATGSKGFYYYLRQPTKPSPGLGGMKIRGTVSYHPMIRALGGAPVNMPGGQVYTALQKGVVDGAAWGRVGVKDFKWYEVASHIATPSFGQVGLMIFANLKKFQKLSPEEQKILVEAGKKLEIDAINHFDRLADQEWEALLKLGMKESPFAPEDAKRLEKLWAEGVWQVAEDKSGQDAKDLRNLAKKNGMTY